MGLRGGKEGELINGVIVKLRTAWAYERGTYIRVF